MFQGLKDRVNKKLNRWALDRVNNKQLYVLEPIAVFREQREIIMYKVKYETSVHESINCDAVEIAELVKEQLVWHMVNMLVEEDCMDITSEIGHYGNTVYYGTLYVGRKEQ